MNNFQFLLHFAFGICIVLLVSGVSAAELRLKTEPIHCNDTLVALKNVAEIVPDAGETAEEIKRLNETVLFAAPAEGEQRTVRTMELRNMLSRLGVASVKHRLVGATQIVLVGNPSGQVPQANKSFSHKNPIQQASVVLPKQSPASYESSNEGKTASASAEASVTAQLVQTLETQLAEALNVYLNHATGSESLAKRSWKIKVELDEKQARQLATGGQIEEIYGGMAPYAGLQHFDIQMQRIDPISQRKLVVSIKAEVTPLHRIVVVRRTLPRGHVINESDVTTNEVEKILKEEFYVDPADVIGMETVAAVRERDILSPKMLKRPNWVRKGEVVTVRSICDGVIVRVSGVAQADACQGDTVVIESLEPTAKNRRGKKNSTPKTYLARVCEPQTVEVHATPTTVQN